MYDGWGLQMVWQDEMCPGIAGTVMKTLPLYIRQYDFGRCACRQLSLSCCNLSWC